MYSNGKNPELGIFKVLYCDHDSGYGRREYFICNFLEWRVLRLEGSWSVIIYRQWEINEDCGNRTINEAYMSVIIHW